MTVASPNPTYIGPTGYNLGVPTTSSLGMIICWNCSQDSEKFIVKDADVPPDKEVYHLPAPRCFVFFNLE
jgi:hypothetical protein